MVALVVKNPPAIQETQEIQVQFLGQEDPLGKGMTTHSSVLTWRVPWIEEPKNTTHRVIKSWTQLR